MAKLIGFFFFLVFLIGMWKMFFVLLRGMGFKFTHSFNESKDPDGVNMPNFRFGRPPSELRAFIDALENEGYFGKHRKTDADITYVDDDVLNSMIRRISDHHELAWVLPEHGLRYRSTPKEAPVAFREKYKHVVMTPTHAIGV